MKLDHIGYITNIIEDTKSCFLLMGYTPGPIVIFDAQLCKVCFLYKEGETTIELVEPYENNKQLRRLLRNGVSPYHLCYEVEDIEKTCTQLSGGGIFCCQNQSRLQLSMEG